MLKLNQSIVAQIDKKSPLYWILQNLDKYLPKGAISQMCECLDFKNKNAINILLKDINTTNFQLTSYLLHQAILSKKTEVIEVLLDNGVILTDFSCFEKFFKKSDDAQYFQFLETKFDLISYKQPILMHAATTEKLALTSYLIENLEIDNNIIELIFNAHCNSYKSKKKTSEALGILVHKLSLEKIKNIIGEYKELEQYLQYYILQRTVNNKSQNLKTKNKL